MSHVQIIFEKALPYMFNNSKDEEELNVVGLLKVNIRKISDKTLDWSKKLHFNTSKTHTFYL